tara:strand:+ start:3446 stop:3922 length:477 start_codon:yes stop_codon:yes gene_type:complete
MSTRSLICYEDEQTKKISSIYCHFDGYLEHNGRILNAHYKDFVTVKELVDGGNIRCLSNTIEDTEYFKNLEDRDGSEEQERTQTHLNQYMLFDYLRADIFIEWVYLFKDGTWHYSYLITEKHKQGTMEQHLDMSNVAHSCWRLLKLADEVQEQTEGAE